MPVKGQGWFSFKYYQSLGRPFNYTTAGDKSSMDKKLLDISVVADLYEPTTRLIHIKPH